jgi:hypothetical protein
MPAIHANNRVLGLRTMWSRFDRGFNIDVHVQKHNDRLCMRCQAEFQIFL